MAHKWIGVVALAMLAGSGASRAQTDPPVTPGFPNVPQTAGALLSGLNAPQQGRTAIIAYHGGVLFTLPEIPSSAPASDFFARTWDLSDPTNPVETGNLGITPMPIQAHGYFKSGNYLVLGSNWPPEAPWSFEVTAPGTLTRTEFPDLLCVGVRGCLFQPWFVGQSWWSYDDITGTASISRDGTELANWDHLALTGVVGHPFLLGDLLIFASDQSRTGVATYDVSDPSNPVLLDVLTTGGAGGYWPEIWGGDGKLYVVFPYRSGGNGFRVVDVTDPTDLQFVTDRPLPGDESMYIQFQDEFAFMGGHKVDMRTFESVLFLDGANATRTNDGGTGISTSQFLLPLGNLLVTGGVGTDQGMAIWAHQGPPDTRGPSVGFHVPQAGRANYPVAMPITLLIHETLETTTLINGATFIVRPVGGAAVAGRLTFSFDDVLTFTPDQDLAADTTYEVVLPAGGIKDAAGNGMVGYSFTFSTGSTVGGNQAPVVQSFTVSQYPAAPGQPVTLSAVGTDPDADPVEYRFDFGDGSARTAWSSTPTAQHTYAAPGHYQATVQLRDPDGSVATGRAQVTVLTAPVGPGPSRSSNVVLAGRRIWTVNPDNDTVTAIDADTLVKELEVPVCDDPRSLATSSAGEIWVACRDDDRVAILDGAGLPLTELVLDYGSAPAGIAFTPDGTTAFLALEGKGELLRFDGTTRQQTGRLQLGPGPRALGVSADGTTVYVTRFLSPKDQGEVWEVDAAAMTRNRTLRLPKLGGDDNRDGTSSGRGVANYLVGITLSPDGGDAWIASTKTNSERGLFFARDLDEDNTVRNMISRIDLGTGEWIESIDLDNSDSAVAVAYSPLGDYLFVALQGSGEILALDALTLQVATGLGSFVTRLATGLAPQGLVVDPVTNRTFVKNFISRNVTALETDDLFRFGNRSPTSSDTSAVATERLSPQVLLGKAIFYNAGDPRMSGEGYLSCATCHVDGGHDGRVWDFTGRGEGFRNTTSLRGRSGMGHGNVHWTANFDEIQDFENDIRGAFGGQGFMDDGDFAGASDPLGAPKAGLSAELDALAAYVASLGAQSVPKSPFRTASGAFTSQGQAGQAVFESLNCATCHAGPEFTDSTVGAPTLHDVGTIRTTSGQRIGGPLTGLDTPTLIGLFNTAPYFHDGSAPTLEDVFRVAGGEVLQSETGTPSAGATIVDGFVNLNNDDTVHGRAYVSLGNTGARLTLSGVDGGGGGLGALEVRYSTHRAQNLEVTVNGVNHTMALEDVGNDPAWRHTNWRQSRLEEVPLNAGPNNTLEIWASDNFPNVSLDDILITTADDRAAAQPHRQVLLRSTAEQADLSAYLRQLDGRQGSGTPPGQIFASGFESGDTSDWSATVP